MSYIPVEVDVHINEVVENLSDKQIEQLYERRFAEKAGIERLTLPTRDQFAEMANTFAERDGLEWINRWLVDYNLELKRRK